MSNYSFETSYPAFKINEATNKKSQCDAVLRAIANGANNLLQISDAMCIPQSTISARISDLMKEKKVIYSGKTFYKDYTRKKIILIQEGKQVEIFG